MAVNWKASAAVFGFIAFSLGILLAIPMRKEYKAYVHRACFVFVIQTLISVGSVNTWHHLTPLMKQLKVQNIVCIRIWKLSVAVFIALSHACYLTVFFNSTEVIWWAFMSFAFLGIFLQLNVCLVFISALRWLCRLVGILPTSRRKHDLCESADCKRSRENITQTVVSMIYAVSVATYGLHQAQQPPTVKNVSVPIQGLPASFDGLRIVQISDIHLGPTVGKSKLTKIVDIVQTLNPELLVVVGDLVDGSVKQLKDAALPLASIHTKYGKYYVTGNHEYYTGDVDNWFLTLEELGFTVLHNQHVKVRQPSGQFFYLAGTDDTEANRIHYGDHGMDLVKAVGSCEAEHPIVLLAHRPAAAKLALDSSYNIQLVLSGHTHGGQIFPFIIGAYMLNPFYAGLYQYKNGHVYVSQGTAYWGIPMRILTSMEITVITVHP